MSKERCLVTGASGFIGSRLCEQLNREGAEVANIPHSILTVPELLAKAVAEIDPSVIYHLAAYGNQYHQSERRKILNANIFGTFNLLETSIPLKLNAFINTGSSSEYGTKNDAMREDMLPEADTYYAATKVGATYLARAFAIQTGMPVVTVRPFSVYGPGEASNRFIPTVIRCAMTGEVLNLAPGVHDWIYVDDFINGMLTVKGNAENLKGEVVNIGSGIQYSNEEIVRIIEDTLGVKVKINRVSSLRSFDNTFKWVADNSKLTNLGWKPDFDIYKGIKQTINEIRTDQ